MLKVENSKTVIAVKNNLSCEQNKNRTTARRVELDSILPFVKKPGRYSGGEPGAVCKDWQQVPLRFCFIFPDLYEIGMSHYGLQILYHLVNSEKDFLAERCYAPDLDMEELLNKQDIPLFSLESRRSLADFDILGITLPYELCYTNILTILAGAGLPLRAKDRLDNDEYPLVTGGGSCSFNPEPVADFFDAIVIGDGEEAVIEMGRVVLAGKEAGIGKREILSRLAEIEGIYVPCFFEPQFVEGRFAGIRPLLEGYTQVRRRVLPELLTPRSSVSPLVPVVKPVHDRLGIEIARGCTRGCRFCQAGIIYRPVRERTVDEIFKIAEEGIAATGFDELALLSLSTGDYSCLPELLLKLMDRFADEFVSVSMPSMRVGTLTPEIIEQIKRVRKTGFTVAPEAGTDRLREVINKGISEDDLLTTCKDAFGAGWNLIKFYFMIGLPTETMEDVEEIVELVKKAKEAAGTGRRAQINVSVALFVPKPHTPFQWQAQLSINEAGERLNLLRKLMPRKGIKLKTNNLQVSFLEGVFSRGDRRLSKLIEKAWQGGVRFDGWSEHFNLQQWQLAAEQCGIILESYLEGRSMSEPLPWDHIDCGVEKTFLEKEWQKALERTYTPDCRHHGCQQCGLCDFKTVKPVLHQDDVKKESENVPVRTQINDRDDKQNRTKFRYRFHYSRLGDSRFYGHLDLLQLVFRVLHRAALPVLFSQGYNPSPKVSFSQALPLGLESMVEFFDVELARPIGNPEKTVINLNCEFPETIRIQDIKPVQKIEPVDIEVSYMANLADGVAMAEIEERRTSFFAEKEWILEKIRKRKPRKLDVRPLVKSVWFGEDGKKMGFILVHRHGQAGISPFEFLEKVLGMSKRQTLLTRIIKVGVEKCSDEV
jgi:radical SAM family uncharacterized protein/radical SAM-linked protein